MKKALAHAGARLLFGTLFVAGAAIAPAAEYAWTNLTNGTWSAPANWVGGTPVSATDTILRFTNSGSTSFTASNNVATPPFQLNQLIFDSTSSGLTRVAGSQLQFNSSGGALPLIIQNGTGAAVISNAIATAADLTFSGTGTGALTANGIISGNNSLIKNSSGLLTLTGANTFGGTNRWVMVNGGTLSVNSTARLGSTLNRVMISSNALLQFTASLTHIRALSLGDGGGRIEVTGNSLVTQSGALTNNANEFTKEGTGTLVLTAGSARTGRTTNNGGLLQLNSSTALGVNNASRVVRINGGTVAHNNATASAATYELSGGTLGVTTNGNLDTLREFSGVIDVQNNSTSRLSIADARALSNAIQTRITGLLTGSGNLDITGATLQRGQLYLTNLLNTYSGVLSINSNVDVFAIHTNGSTLGSGTIVLNQGATLSLQAGTTNLMVTNRNTNFIYNNSIIARGDSILDIRRAINIAAVVSNTIVLQGLSVSNATLTTMSGNNYAYQFTGGGTLEGQSRLLVSNGLVTVDGPFADGAVPGTLIKAGGGNLLLTNAVNRTFTGGTVVEGGILTFTATDATPLPLGTSNITLAGGTLRPRVNSVATNLIVGPGLGYDITVTAPSTIQVGGVPGGQANLTEDFGALTLGPDLLSMSASNGHVLRFSGPVTFTGNVAISNTGTMTLNGPFSDGGSGYGLAKTGTGTLVLSNLISRDFNGPVSLAQGTLRVNLAPGLTNTLGSQPTVFLSGTNSTLELRTTGVNASFDRSAGVPYNLAATNAGSVARVRLQREGAAGTGQVISVGDLTLANGVRFVATNANNYVLQVAGTTTIGRNVIFDNAAAPVAGTIAFELAGPIVESASHARFTKTGFSQPMSYTGTSNPGFTGGTFNDAGLLAWRPDALPSGTYRFGTGAIQLDNGGIFGFQNNLSNSYTLENDFIIGGSRSGNGRTNYGAVLDFARIANSPQVDNTGTVRLRAPLAIHAGTAGSATPATFSGPVVLESDTAALVVNASGTGNGRRVTFSGAISNDDRPRNLTLVANNTAVLSIEGDNSAFAGDFLFQQAYSGNAGRVRFETTNALPGGKVRAAAETISVLGFNLGTAGVTNVFNRFQFSSNAVLALEESNAQEINLASLGQDVRLGVPEGFTVTNTGLITPFNNKYKLGGGGGTLVFNTADALRDNGVTPRSLDALAHPYSALSGGAAPGIVSVTGSNSFTGGVTVNSGILSISSGRTNTPLGTGPVHVYGVLRATTANGSFADAAGTDNNNVITTHAGSEIRLENSALNTNRWGDNAALALDGALFNYIGFAGVNQRSTERIGALTFQAGSRLGLVGATNAGASAVLSVASLSRVGNGTLQLNRSANNLGQSNQFLVDGGLPLVNGVVAPYIVNAIDHQFVTYGATGFSNAPATSTDLNTAAATDTVSVAGNTTLGSDRSIHALRLGANLTAGGGSVVEIGSGGLIHAVTSTNTGVTLRFGPAGAGEGLVYVASNATAVFNNTTLAAAGGLTKFGEGTLSLVTPNPAYGSGWNLNRGTLTLATGSGGGGLGTATAGNFVNLNGGVTLNLAATNEGLTHLSGLVTARETNSITASFGDPGRTQTFAPLGLRLETSGTGPLESFLRVAFNEQRSVLNTGGRTTLADDAAIAVQNTTVVSGSSNRLVLAGGLAGTNVTLFKRGNGTLAVGGNNSAQLIGARTHVEQGVLAVGNNGALGNGTSAATIAPGAVLQIDGSVNGFVSTAPITFASGSAERWAHPLARFNDLSTPQTFTLPTGVSLQVMATMTNFTDKIIQLRGGSLEAYLHADDSRTNNNLSISGVNLELLADSKIGQTGIDFGRGGSTLNFYGDITDDGNGRSLTKVGPDTVVLRGANLSYGGTTVIDAGILRLSRSEMLPDSGALHVGANGILELNNFDETVAALSGSGRITTSLTNPNTLAVDISVNSVFNGTLEGDLSLNRIGSATFYVGGPSTTTGTFITSGGSVVVTAGTDPVTGGTPLGNATNGTAFLTGPASILTGAAIDVARDIRVDIVFGGTKVIGGGTAQNSSFSGDIALYDNVTLTATNGGRVDFNGSIFDTSAPRGVSKSGAGTVNLTAANFWRGGTGVTAGTLLVNNTTGSATGSGNVTVLGGATLGGSGRIAGSVTLNSGAALTPGNSAGLLRIDANLSLTNLATVTFEIGGLIKGVNYDHLAVGTNISFAGLINLSLDPGYFPAGGDSFELVSFGTRAGTFNNAANGARVATTDSLGSFQINYNATNVVAAAFQYNDSDLDGIYDAWAVKHFGIASLVNGTGPTERFGDFDGDGLNNYGEFIAGMIPTNAASFHAITTAAVSGTGNYVVRFPAPAETQFRTPVYQIQYTGDLGAPIVWTTVVAPTLNTSVPGVIEWIDDGTLTGGTAPLALPGNRFYRVQVE